MNTRMVIITVVAGLVVTTGALATTTFKGQGTILFDKIKTKNITITGTANITGSVQNTTRKKPVKVNDDLLVTGSLNAKSITGLSEMVRVAGFIKASDLGTSRLSDNTHNKFNLAPYENVGEMADVLSANIDVTIALYDYLDCVNNWNETDQWCWDNIVGYSIRAIEFLRPYGRDIRYHSPY